MDDRAGRHLEAMARRRWWAYARRNQRLLFRIIGVLAVTVAVGSIPAMAFYGPFGRGFVLGCLSTVCTGFLVLAVAHESGALRAMEGAVGEQNTAWVLRRLERDGWQVRNDVLFDGVNVDHVAVGPGGVLAVETKSTSRRWDFGARDLDPFAEAALRQARAGARKIRLLLSGLGSFDVTAVLMCWGPNVADVPGGWVLRDGVVVIVGRNASEAMPSCFRAPSSLDRHTVDCAVHHIDAFVASRDRHERLRHRRAVRS